MASSQIAYAGGDVVVTINAIDSTGTHVAVTGLNASRLSINGTASAVVPTVANPDTGIYVLTWTPSTATSEGDSIVALIDGSVAGTAFSTYGIPVKVVASERGTDNASTFNASTDTVDIGKINGNATSASNLQKSTSQIIQGTVASSPTPTNTAISQSATFGATGIFSSSIPDDAYIGRLIVFTSGTFAGQATDITDYAWDAGNSVGFFTTTNLTLVDQQSAPIAPSALLFRIR
jgi:hypothetical protein